MKKTALFFCLILLLTACEKHFITDANYRKQVHNDFLERQIQAQGRADALFSIFDQDLTLEEREALEFLYAYMPLSDLADYDGEFFLRQVKTAFAAREHFAWGDSIPEDIFRHFVLVYRVNNENLDSARMVFFNELKPRLEGLSMYDAALEVNHWCHEHVAYRPSDIRTSSPLATMRTGLGRCGEESTFTVTALRSVGIPARQCYTPRWAHCDDNHAWVEVWVNGRWYFLGACEPDPELNMGWFAIPSTRTMMVHSNAFGRYNGDEEVTLATPLYSKINMLSNYAEHKTIVINVVDKDGKAVENAEVKFKLYNYSEYYPIATQNTNKEGIAKLTTGLGTLMIWANKEQKYGYEIMDIRKTDKLTIVLDREAGSEYVESLTIVPPAGNCDIVTATPEKVAANSRRLQYEDSIRNAYLSTFKTEADTDLIVNPNIDKNDVGILLKKSEGNYDELISFINNHSKKNDKLYLKDFLFSLSDKDLRDFSSATLEDHITYYHPENYHNPDNLSVSYPFDVYLKGIISPRIANEGLRPWRGFLKTQFLNIFKEEKNISVDNVKEWIAQNIRIDNDENYYNCPISPRGVFELGIADEYSRDIFFVAVCRAIDIPAYMDNATGQLFYFENQAWKILSFNELKEEIHTGTLVLEYTQDKPERPVYWTNFTLAKYENGDFVSFDFENDPRVEKFPITLELETGYYLISSGNRYTDGTALSRLEFFNIKEGETLTKNLVIRNLEEKPEDYGTIDFQAYHFKDKDGNALKNGPWVLCFIDPTREPTKHLLKEISTAAIEFEQWNRPLIFVVPSDKNAADFNFEDWHLPKNSILCVDEDNNILKNTLSHIKSTFSDNFPLVLYVDKDGNIKYLSEGYHIGTAKLLLDKKK